MVAEGPKEEIVAPSGPQGHLQLVALDLPWEVAGAAVVVVVVVVRACAESYQLPQGWTDLVEVVEVVGVHQGLCCQ